MEREPFPFFVGCGRSGTTLLRAMFDAHPSMAVPPESWFIPYMAQRRARFETTTGFRSERFVTDLTSSKRFALWNLAPEVVASALASDPPASLADAVRALYARYAAAQGKTRYADKTPGYVVSMPALAGLLPESRFVHIHRDGREVALSFVDAPFGPKTLSEAAEFWVQRVRAGRTAGLELGPDRYLEIRYDALVSDTEDVVRGICRFVHLEFDPIMLRYYERSDRIVSGFAHPEQHRHIGTPPTRGLRDWRSQMTAEDVRIFDAIGGDLLEELGYDRS